ncbi:MAG: hypothetical protein R2911_05995 [Caldilineaceae bacterium]
MQAAQIATCSGLTSALFVGISDPLPSDDAALVAYLTNQLGMAVAKAGAGCGPSI